MIPGMSLHVMGRIREDFVPGYFYEPDTMILSVTPLSAFQ